MARSGHIEVVAHSREAGEEPRPYRASTLFLETTMTAATRLTSLRYVMIATGVIFAFGIYPLTQIWPAGWSWGAGPSHYRMMIIDFDPRNGGSIEAVEDLIECTITATRSMTTAR